MKLSSHKEIVIGKHYLTLGHDLKSFTVGIHINKYSFDINLYPFYIGIEWRGVDIDNALMAKVMERLNQSE